MSPVVPEIYDFKKCEEAMDMIIIRVLIGDPGHPIMMTPGITRSVMIGVILRIYRY